MVPNDEYADVPLPYKLEEVDRSDDAELVPAGTYLLEVTRSRYMPAKSGSNPLLILSLKVIDAADPAQENYRGAGFIEFIQATFEVKWKMAQFLDAIFGRKVSGERLQAPTYVGKRFVGNVEINDYMGKKSSKCGRYMPLTKWHKAGDVPAATAPVFDIPKDQPASAKPADEPPPHTDDEVTI
jgi:hypothetical protein